MFSKVARTFTTWDELNLVEELSRRPSVLKSPPAFLRGAFRSALKLAINETGTGMEIVDDVAPHVVV